MLECDVQCSRDGTVVVLHDAHVDRTTDGHGWVRSLTWRELKQLDAGAWFGAAFRGERLPALEDLLALCGRESAPEYRDQTGHPTGAPYQEHRRESRGPGRQWQIAGDGARLLV